MTDPEITIRLAKQHPITGTGSDRGRWTEHEGVIFHLSPGQAGSKMWTIRPDTEHLNDASELTEFIRSRVYWSTSTTGLRAARAALQKFLVSSAFAALREAYLALPMRERYIKRPALDLADRRVVVRLNVRNVDRVVTADGSFAMRPTRLVLTYVDLEGSEPGGGWSSSWELEGRHITRAKRLSNFDAGRMTAADVAEVPPWVTDAVAEHWPGKQLPRTTASSEALTRSVLEARLIARLLADPDQIALVAELMLDTRAITHPALRVVFHTVVELAQHASPVTWEGVATHSELPERDLNDVKALLEQAAATSHEKGDHVLEDALQLAEDAIRGLAASYAATTLTAVPITSAPDASEPAPRSSREDHTTYSPPDDGPSGAPYRLSL